MESSGRNCNARACWDSSRVDHGGGEMDQAAWDDPSTHCIGILLEHYRGALPPWLSPDQVVTLAEQVGDALDAAHREGIIHRDIKPENLLVGGDGLVRLADFGVARVPDAALTGEGQFLGTPCYGAPETLRGGEAGPLSDQFSLAAVLYEAATGARAFPGSR